MTERSASIRVARADGSDYCVAVVSATLLDELRIACSVQHSSLAISANGQLWPIEGIKGLAVDGWAKARRFLRHDGGMRVVVTHIYRDMPLEDEAVIARCLAMAIWGAVCESEAPFEAPVGWIATQE